MQLLLKFMADRNGRRRDRGARKASPPIRAALADSVSSLLKAGGAGELAGGRSRWHRTCCVIDPTFISFYAANAKSAVGGVNGILPSRVCGGHANFVRRLVAVYMSSAERATREPACPPFP
jgi:hypothetical protein